MRIYVVRIYRQNTRRFRGVLEDAQTGGSVAFHTLRELTDLLRTTSVQAASKRRRPAGAARAASKHSHKGDTAK
jgi:hypothetical protein